MDLGLTDKVAIVTGSSRGLGLASARALVGALAPYFSFGTIFLVDPPPARSLTWLSTASAVSWLGN